MAIYILVLKRVLVENQIWRGSSGITVFHISRLCCIAGPSPPIRQPRIPHVPTALTPTHHTPSSAPTQSPPPLPLLPLWCSRVALVLFLRAGTVSQNLTTLAMDKEYKLTRARRKDARGNLSRKNRL